MLCSSNKYKYVLLYWSKSIPPKILTHFKICMGNSFSNYVVWNNVTLLESVMTYIRETNLYECCQLLRDVSEYSLSSSGFTDPTGL
jgi:hypothetical protein